MSSDPRERSLWISLRRLLAAPRAGLSAVMLGAALLVLGVTLVAADESPVPTVTTAPVTEGPDVLTDEPGARDDDWDDDEHDDDRDDPDDRDDGDEPPIPPDELERAGEAALQAAPGGTVVSVDRESEEGGAWEVEVRLADGSVVDVVLDESFRLVSTGPEQDDTGTERDDEAAEPDDDASGIDDDVEEPVSASDYDRAAQAALDAAGGGTVESVDHDAEDGGSWEVEVRDANGRSVDVVLGADFAPISVEPETD